MEGKWWSKAAVTDYFRRPQSRHSSGAIQDYLLADAGERLIDEDLDFFTAGFQALLLPG